MLRVVTGLQVADAGTAAFLTLTSLPGTTVREMMASWNRFKGTLRREIPTFQYAAIKEFGTTTGMLHLHVVLTRWSFVAQNVLSAMWRRASHGAYVVDIRAIADPAQTARYVAKYVSKTIARIDVRKAVTYSRDWPKLPDRPARWSVTGAESERAASPPKHWVAVLAGGALVHVDAGCDCVGETGKEYGGRDVWIDRERQRRESERWRQQATSPQQSQ